MSKNGDKGWLSDADELPKGLIGVYAIFLTQNPSKGYIGSSKCIKSRLKTHLAALKRGKHKNWQLQAMFKKNEDTYKYVLLDVTNDEDEARASEQRFINRYPDDLLYNVDKQVYSYKR